MPIITNRSSDWFSHYFVWILLGATIFFRMASLWTPLLDVDESQFVGYAQALLDGGKPYVDSVDTKPLGIYWFFAIILSLFGKYNMIAVHAVTILWVFITALYIGRITEKLYGYPTAFIAALLYSVYSTCYFPKIISTSITIIMMLPLTMSLWQLIQWEEKRKTVLLFFSGILFGIGCLFKYQAGVQLLAVLTYFLCLRPFYGHKLKNEIGHFLVFFLGGITVGLCFILYIVSIGVWNDFYFYTVYGNAAYLSKYSDLTSYTRNFLNMGSSFVIFTLPLWIFGLMEAGHRISQRKAFITIWLLSSTFAVIAGGRFFGHYFIQLLPALCILASQKCFLFLQILKPKRILLLLSILILLTPPMIAFGLRLNISKYYDKNPEDHPELYRDLGEYIRKHSSPKDKIFVWGFATPVYFFSERQASSRFLWSDWLTGRISGSPKKNYFVTEKVAKKSWRSLLKDLRQHQPLYIVDTSPGNYHSYKKYPLKAYSAMKNLTQQLYFLEKRYKGADFYRRKSQPK